MVADVKTSVSYQTVSEADTWQHLPNRILQHWGRWDWILLTSHEFHLSIKLSLLEST